MFINIKIFLKKLLKVAYITGRRILLLIFNNGIVKYCKYFDFFLDLTLHLEIKITNSSHTWSQDLMNSICFLSCVIVGSYNTPSLLLHCNYIHLKMDSILRSLSLSVAASWWWFEWKMFKDVCIKTLQCWCASWPGYTWVMTKWSQCLKICINNSSAPPALQCWGRGDCWMLQMKFCKMSSLLLHCNECWWLSIWCLVSALYYCHWSRGADCLTELTAVSLLKMMMMLMF